MDSDVPTDKEVSTDQATNTELTCEDLDIMLKERESLKKEVATLQQQLRSARFSLYNISSDDAKISFTLASQVTLLWRYATSSLVLL